MALLQGDELGFPHFHIRAPKFLKKIPGAGLVGKIAKYSVGGPALLAFEQRKRLGKLAKKGLPLAASFAVGGPGGAAALLALKNRKRMGKALIRLKGGR